jgi:hypothetical protein
MSQENSLPRMRSPKVARGVGLLDRAGEAAVGQVELAADVDEAVADAERVARDQHRFDQHVRVVLEDPAVLERARLALVGVGDEVVGLAVVGNDDLPLAAHREGGAAAALQARGGDFLGDVRRLHLAEHLGDRAVPAAGAVFRERVRGRGHREGHDELAARHGYFSPSSSSSTFSNVRFS